MSEPFIYSLAYPYPVTKTVADPGMKLIASQGKVYEIPLEMSETDAIRLKLMPYLQPRDLQVRAVREAAGKKTPHELATELNIHHSTAKRMAAQAFVKLRPPRHVTAPKKEEDAKKLLARGMTLDDTNEMIKKKYGSGIDKAKLVRTRRVLNNK
jgi:hypothetical protein